MVVEGVSRGPWSSWPAEFVGLCSSCVAGAFLYALGIVIQRAAFTSQHKRCIPHRQAWWTFGLCVYGAYSPFTSPRQPAP